MQLNQRCLIFAIHFNLVMEIAAILIATLLIVMAKTTLKLVKILQRFECFTEFHDLDECTLNTDQCDSVVGSYTLSCDAGWDTTIGNDQLCDKKMISSVKIKMNGLEKLMKKKK